MPRYNKNDIRGKRRKKERKKESFLAYVNIKSSVFLVLRLEPNFYVADKRE